ncbi:MAG: DUF4358 domain-containing protein [Oscillospiraceae bacterium]|nr:DUF4358 domain-containing protein [Oscillospiraceae bacterium]
MKKRLLALLLALAVTAALTACGGKQDPTEGEMPNGNIETAEPGQSTDTEEPEDGEDASAADAADRDEPEQEEQPETGTHPADPAEQPEGGNLPADTAQKPESKPVQKPEELPAQKPADSQSKPAPTADLTAFYDTLSAGEDWPAMMQAEGEVLDAFYPGLSDISTNQCAVYTAMISAAVGEIALVEVRSADDVQKVQDIFQARVDYQVGDDENPGGAWYPQTIEGWKNGSRIVSNGNFVMLVALSDGADGVVTAFNALFA